MNPGDRQFASMAFLWPALAAETTSEIAAAAAREFVKLAVGPAAGETNSREPQWTTRNKIALELSAVRMRDFSTRAEGTTTLVCAPFALHGATIVDFAPHHSLVAALQSAGMNRVFVTDWRSATPEMRFWAIDDYLAALNVLVEELGGAVDLIGLCQGGWMALVYAARFPAKVRKLVLAGAPIDLAAGKSRLSELTDSTPSSLFTELVELGEGRILGQHMLSLWAPEPERAEIHHLLEAGRCGGFGTVSPLGVSFPGLVRMDRGLARQLLPASRWATVPGKPSGRRRVRRLGSPRRPVPAALSAVPACRKGRRHCRPRADIRGGASDR